MIILTLHIILIASLAAVACALPGIFLVLRGVALMSDAISHAILPGIAIMFLLVQKLESPWLIVGASLAGLLTVFCTEQLINTQRIKKDAAIGLVFPLFFSIGVIIISLYARNVHLDTDMVLLGELAFAPFNRLKLFGMDMGPYALWSMGAIFIMNVVFVVLCYKELQLITFDHTLAHLFGFQPTLLYYSLMTVTSITAVGAFDVVGSIVAVALMITPAATAYLCTHTLKPMVFLTILLAMSAAIGGYVCAHQFDVSIAGSIASVSGLLFMCALLAAPEKGLIARMYYDYVHASILSQKILCTYLAHAPQHNHIDTIAHQLGWQRTWVQFVVRNARQRNIITEQGGFVSLTDQGHSLLQLSAER